MNRKGSLNLLLSLAAMGQGFMASGHGFKVDSFRSFDAKRPNGVRKFIIEGKEVWAINQKNAIRKAKKSTL